MATWEFITMNNGLKIPQIGFGTYKLLPNEKCEEACITALEFGYRHIDTAHYYKNEKGVGEAIIKSGIKREQLFITTKIWPSEFGKGITEKVVDGSLKRLKLTYIDLVLLHWPFGNYLEAWKDLEKCVKDGKTKSIGLSNFYDKELKEILEIATIKPVLDQVECHPLRNQFELKKILEKENILIESWAPLGRFSKDLIENKEILKLAEKYNKNVAQIVMRWQIEKGYIPIPKSENPEHIKTNYSIFDFKLTEEEIKTIDNIPQKNVWSPAKYGGFEKFKEMAVTTVIEDE